MKWCEHIHMGINIHHESGWCLGSDVIVNHKDWKFCPICGTPLPNKKTLEDKFREELEVLYRVGIDHGIAGSCLTYPWRNLARDLVKIAEQHFKEKDSPTP